MASFFEKLKKGMGVELAEEAEKTEGTERTEAVLKEKEKSAPKKKKIKKLEIETTPMEPAAKKEELKKAEEPESVPEKPKENPRGFALQNLGGQEGQLAIDVYQTDKDIVIQTAIAGIKSEDLDISIEADTVLIRGIRSEPLERGEKNYFYQECFWGPFSRQIILPEETDPSHAEAIMKEGVLTIRIPKIERKKKRKIAIRG